MYEIHLLTNRCAQTRPEKRRTRKRRETKDRGLSETHEHARVHTYILQSCIDRDTTSRAQQTARKLRGEKSSYFRLCSSPVQAVLVLSTGLRSLVLCEKLYQLYEAAERLHASAAATLSPQTQSLGVGGMLLLRWLRISYLCAAHMSQTAMEAQT